MVVLMAEITITNPDIHAEKMADAQGRVYLGTEWENENVRITVEKVDTDV